MAVVQKSRGSPPKVRRGRPPKKEQLSRKKISDLHQTTDDQKKAISIIIPGNGECDNPKKPIRHKRKRATVDSLYVTSQAKSSVFERAKEVQANLAPEFPSMIKCMLPSHVTGGFWLGLAKQFCQLHMPKEDTIIVLVDESGKEYETKYLAEKVGLSSGWRGFSIAHSLLEGDVLVFHLVQPSKFKVYIVRSNDSDEVDGALALLKLDGCMKQMDLDDPHNCKTNSMVADSNEAQIDLSENVSEGFDPEVLDGIKLSESVINFEEVRGIENFIIVVDGLVIDSEFSEYLRTKYYELCCSQKSFLHDHLLEGLNCKLAAGIIAETINIADAIKACKITTSEDSFATWDKTLKAFEVMGMNIGFLRARLDQLINLALKSKRYKEVRLERDHAEREMKTLEAKLVEVKQTITRLDSEIGTLYMNSEKLENMFQELASAPWW
ncbi:B3 domain-containing protein [Quillaja saponaria]|uniref:B3 domain-containing protein n=1 Tax=Quillaja saponaria TaxID=32244 RepID=A0AAD7M075_QUISA|nr:B3 domain-containing protein [Quillaja saponaria]